MDELTWLEKWFLSNCNGDWEHADGVRIETLDNPGWTLRINISGTKLEKESFKEIELERDKNNWLKCWVEKDSVTGSILFRGVGGPLNLNEILKTFRIWNEKHLV